MLSDPVAEAFGLIHRHPSGENFCPPPPPPDLPSVGLLSRSGVCTDMVIYRTMKIYGKNQVDYHVF